MRLALGTIAAVIAATATGTAAGEPNTRPTPTLIAETQVATWQCQDRRGVDRSQAAQEPWALPKGHAYRAWVLNLWKLRLIECRAQLREQARQWDWQAWLPANWQAVARCETHYNWRHANGRFVSAFGISRREYDADAAYMGAPPWNDARPPTPWQQYQAALGHYRRFGDGWGCPGP